jgi:hypothetical protein
LKKEAKNFFHVAADQRETSSVASTDKSLFASFSSEKEEASFLASSPLTFCYFV